ncbi:MAG: AAA family ATPase [Bacteroidales bacterium]|jgi:exodeoxyribonuclease-5|nr:AAA family ATPase [Bacteroidales bacterium]
MLKNHLKDIFFHHLNFEPTEGQRNVIDVLSEMMVTPDNQRISLIKGYAGTGKTSVVSAFVKTLNDFKIRSVLMAPTGRAAKVLSAYSEKEAFTIHKKIYRQKKSTDIFSSFHLDYNPDHHTFFIVDEASMISRYSTDQNLFGSGNLLDDLIRFVYNDHHCQLVLIGDTAQLPPVGQEESPALDKHLLESYGLKVSECLLTEVVRQSRESGILCNATIVRQMISGKQSAFPVFRMNFPDVQRISGEDLIETISDAYEKYGIEETAIICRSNKQANRYNQGIRNRVLYREEELTPGDLLMVVRNNYFWIQDSEDISFIANGDIVKVVRIIRYFERYDFRFAEVELSLPDYNDREFTAMIMLDVLSSEVASITAEQTQKLFYSVAEDYSHIPTKKKRYEKIREDAFFNALQVKYAYAVTCHKAQGGQWQYTFLDQGWVKNESPDIEYLRWLYTAITRASGKLYLVNFPDKFFNGL